MPAELWAILDGLTIAWECGIRNLEVETDSLEAVRCRSSTDRPHEPTITKRIRLPLDKQRCVSINFIHRESNVLADYMTKLERIMDMGLALFQYPPMEAQRILLFDRTPQRRRYPYC
ncbi:hypothetical protein F3Y22_tig00110156pilonHSYRG00394 [Hibiscus syriacus]|uniref:RNase H type-1 domain-containing protein n=1 Tax=Hibiscus syriacus TaxID=106335 RepID=A0A6A3BL04_HIBSY|nr:uncharacterized protein LOC120215790 [Hibiscus syriacus]KAE8716108.1 hypothetical protein F3Y22_tig00110156pilonHSYRG00394 [Hibiscus syriacus]